MNEESSIENFAKKKLEDRLKLIQLLAFLTFADSDLSDAKILTKSLISTDIMKSFDEFSKSFYECFIKNAETVIAANAATELESFYQVRSPSNKGEIDSKIVSWAKHHNPNIQQSSLDELLKPTKGLRGQTDRGPNQSAKSRIKFVFQNGNTSASHLRKIEKEAKEIISASTNSNFIKEMNEPNFLALYLFLNLSKFNVNEQIDIVYFFKKYGKMKFDFVAPDTEGLEVSRFEKIP